ncbi:MAG: hypothetical protein QXT13_12130 [Pyrobaculum sp.]
MPELKEMLEKIKDAKKFVAVTWGNKIHSPYPLRRRYYLTIWGDLSVLAKAEKLLWEIVSYYLPPFEKYVEFCTYCNEIRAKQISYIKMCKRHRSVAEIPLFVLWHSNEKRVYGFYYTDGDIIYIFMSSRWLLLGNTSIAYIKRPDGTVFRYQGDNSKTRTFDYIIRGVYRVVNALLEDSLKSVEYRDP